MIHLILLVHTNKIKGRTITMVAEVIKETTASMEDYLEAIAMLNEEGKVARVTQISQTLGVKKPSVTSALKKLSDDGLVKHERYGYVALTPEGARIAMDVFRRMGLPVVEHARNVPGIQAAIEYCEEWEEKRHTLEYDIDGIVVKVDDLGTRDQLGRTAKYPRWAVAYKYKAEQKETVLRDIVMQVGKTGVLTPVAMLEPVFISGSTVSKASLHNFDETVPRRMVQRCPAVSIPGPDIGPVSHENLYFLHGQGNITYRADM